ncbi:MAG TPA: phosphoserine phosphatase SerB [Anaerolineales bacterium]|nr:phosphoserine phosphatase SerB [Anaerolineales bacterium]
MKEPILISITGMDRPGITATITQVLADFDADVLDIGQSVIHDSLSLGMLVQIPSQVTDPNIVINAVQRAVDNLNLTVRFVSISRESYGDWVSQQGKGRHIVTLLARRITAHHISRLADIIAAHGLNIDKITRLSGRVALESIGNGGQACVEFSIRGPVADLPALRREFMELADKIDVDIAYQENNVYRRNRRLVAFDMDSTLIQGEVIDELAKRAGVGKQISEITERAMHGEIDFKESLRQRVCLLKGLPESTLAEVAATLKITGGTERLMSTLKKLGYKTAILSGGFTYFGRALQRRFGFDYVFANEPEIENGTLTGNLAADIVDGERKASLLASIAQHEGFSLEQTIAVGDGANDLEMLSIAGLGIAFHAKPIVRESAKQSLRTLGLDSILYLMGLSERETTTS